MNYQIAIDPNLALDLDEFITAWNDTPACRALAQAQLAAQSPQGFSPDPQLVQQGLVLLTGAAGAAGALALDALKDAVKDKLAAYFKEKLAKKPSIRVNAVRQTGGAYLLVVTEESE